MQQQQDNTTLGIEPQSILNQRQQFWTLQIGGWIGYALVVFIAIIRPQFDSPNFNFPGQLLNLLLEVLTGFCFCYLQWTIIRKTVHLPLKHTLVISFVSAAILGLMFNIIKLATYKVVVFHQVWYEQWNMLEFGGWFLFSVSTMFIWTAIFFIMLYNTRLQKEHEMLLRAQTAAKEAQLQMLRYQLNPHFMFNTMNAISTLIYKKDNDKAGEMLDKLCAFFRYSLDQQTTQATHFAKELELLNLYLSIEAVRFGERLSVAIQVEDLALSAKVPALFLQPLVENAIKYAVEPNKQGGRIDITARVLDGMVHLSVVDNGANGKIISDKGFGIGLSNTRERLETMFNQRGSLTVQPSEQGTQVTIIFPFKQVEAND